MFQLQKSLLTTNFQETTPKLFTFQNCFSPKKAFNLNIHFCDTNLTDMTNYQILPLFHTRNRKKPTTQTEWAVHSWNEHQPNFLKNAYSFKAKVRRFELYQR